MIWVTWRQHRGEASIVAAVLALLAIFLLRTGLDMASGFQQSGLADCLTQAAATGARGACSDLTTAFKNEFGFLYGLSFWLSVLLALLGVLVGAPLVARELEEHTHLMVWTQSITRSRWLAVKLSVVLGAGLLASGALMALLIWWYVPFAQVDGRFTPTAFDFEGPVWLAATVLVLAVGILAGALTRHTVVAMFITLVLFLGIRLPVEFFLRPNYEPAITLTWPLNGQDPGTVSAVDWTLSRGWLDAQGKEFTNLRCAANANQTVTQCLQSQGDRGYYVTYQPADRFWTFQWIETSIYLACAALALGAAVWLVRRRLN